MSKKRGSDGALLEAWRPPRGAGDPVGCLATTFTFDPQLFDEECLARFLEIDSLADREGLAYLLEREDRLGPTYAGILVDHRQAGVDHSLRWDVLPVRIPRGKQHAKLSLLAWTRHVRVVIASANLTTHGYRFNQEVAGTIELSPDKAPHSLLTESCDFLESLFAWVAGTAEDPAIQRAHAFITLVRKQVSSWTTSPRSSHLTNHLAFTLPSRGGRAAASSLDSCISACRSYGSLPSRVWIASPFFDPAVPPKSDEVASALCKQMGRGTRGVTFCVPAIGNEQGKQRLAAPKSLIETVEPLVDQLSVEALPSADKDKNPRPWHAKMLSLEANQYTTLMIGSSNFTKAGMGIGGVHNAEANLIYVARRGREATDLDQCWPETRDVRNFATVEWAGPQLEQEEEERVLLAPPLPMGFVSAQYRAGKHPAILLSLRADKLPSQWQILGGHQHDHLILNASEHQRRGQPASLEMEWQHDYAPGRLLVIWEEDQAFWSLNVVDQSLLPAPREIESMTAQDLLYILAASDSSAAFRVVARKRLAALEFDDELDSAVPPDLDPLRRYDLHVTFLHRVRRQARLLAAVRKNLERPVWSEQALQWRLGGMIGVRTLADRLAKGLTEPNGTPAEAVFNLADLLLTLADIDYREQEGAMSRRRFNGQLQKFLSELSAELSQRIKASENPIPTEVRQFWTRVRERCQK